MGKTTGLYSDLKFKVLQGISVIICCYNSVKRLPKTLEHLANQQVEEGINWELIIVDNNSTDETAITAKTVWAQLGNPALLTVVSENKAGLSYAREKGLAVSKYELLLLCDDDNWLQQDYIARALAIMQGDAKIGILGGRGIEACEVPPPEWFELQKSNYAVGAQDQQSGDVTLTRKYVYGAGAVVRKSAWLHVKERGFKSILSDRKGDSLSSGGDVELCLVLGMAGYKVWYDEQLVFQHFIPKERLTWDYIVRLKKGFAVTHLGLMPYLHFTEQKPFRWIRDMRFFIKNLIKDKVRSMRNKTEREGDNLAHLDYVYHLTLVKEFLRRRSAVYEHSEYVQKLNNSLRNG